jgi:pimeloyl-ACP methyl ester carboxylesterase
MRRWVAPFVCLAIGCSGGEDFSTPAPSGDDGGGQLDAGGVDSSAPAGDGGASDGGASDAREAAAPDAGIDPGPRPTQQCTFTKDANGFFKLTSPRSDYWVRLPPSYDVQSPTPRALLVALHGCGDSAFNFATWGAVPYALRTSQDYIAISIGGRDGQCWTMNTDGPIVTEAIAHARGCFWVHQKKIVLAGYSSGGMLAYNIGMKSAASYAGLLVENSGLSQGVGGSNAVNGVLAAAAWKINVAHTARTEDGSFAIAGVRADRDKMIAAGFPLQYRELPGDHNGTSDDWSQFLIPKMASWMAP